VLGDFSRCFRFDAFGNFPVAAGVIGSPLDPLVVFFFGAIIYMPQSKAVEK
jgi:hypothetical protein